MVDDSEEPLDIVGLLDEASEGPLTLTSERDGPRYATAGELPAERWSQLQLA